MTEDLTAAPATFLVDAVNSGKRLDAFWRIPLKFVSLAGQGAH